MTVDVLNAIPMEQVLQNAAEVGVTKASTPRGRRRQWLAIAGIPIMLTGILVSRPLLEGAWTSLTTPSIRDQETMRLASREAASFIEHRHTTAMRVRAGAVKQLASGYYRVAVTHEDRNGNEGATEGTAMCVVDCSRDRCFVEAVVEGQ